MNQLTKDEIQVGTTVLFKPLVGSKEWTIDIIGYIAGGTVTLMSYGELPMHFGFFPYDKLAQTYLLLHDEHISEESLTTFEANLKDSYL